MEVNYKLKEIPLRERKAAQTKLSLLKAASDKMLEKHLDEISVKELCDEVQISEGTFFNYFPKKTDLLVYYIQLWSVEVSCNAKNNTGKEKPYDIIENIFKMTAEKFIEGIKIMDEIIAFFATSPEVGVPPKLTKAELLMAYPECEGIEDINPPPFYDIFKEHLEKAVKTGDLPNNTDINIVNLGLWSIFFGIPLLCRLYDVTAIGFLYSEQLKIYWNGIKNSFINN